MKKPIVLSLVVLLSCSLTHAGELQLAQAVDDTDGAPLLADAGTVRFVLRLKAMCADDEELATISVALADTRRAVDPAALDEQGRTDITLGVPARQLMGINRRLLCSDSRDGEGSATLLQGAYSANAAARCNHPERGTRTLYASTDVDVYFRCGEPDQSDGDTADES